MLRILSGLLLRLDGVTRRVAHALDRPCARGRHSGLLFRAFAVGISNCASTAFAGSFTEIGAWQQANPNAHFEWVKIRLCLGVGPS